MASAPAPTPFPAEHLLPDLTRSTHLGDAIDPKTISAAVATPPASSSASSPASASASPQCAHPPIMATSSNSVAEFPRAYNHLATAYSKRTPTASTVASNRTAVGAHPQLQPLRTAPAGLQQRINAGRSPDALQSRVYGLTSDLREPVTNAANQPTVDDTNRIARLLDQQRSNFSVEVFAPSFDHRGYPVLSGRAAQVRGVVRMPATKGCDVMMTISAHTTTGSPAAVWQGTALAPWATGAEKTVFEINDRLVANYDLVRPRAAYAPKNEQLMEPPQASKEDLVLPIPFQVQLPLGKSTRFVDGEMQAVPVSLPPSFEISSKFAAQEKREIRLATKGKAKGPMAKELIEKGFEKVYRIGCYYQVTWTLIRPNGGGGGDKTKKGSKSAASQAEEGDTLTLPFIFMGEPTTVLPHPATLPATISPDVFTEPGMALGDQWAVHRSQAKWSGALIKAMRKTVDIELHMPTPLVLQAPSVLPIMVVLRPIDPSLLSQIRTRAPSETSTAPGSPAVTQIDDPIETIATPPSPMVPSNGSSTVAASPITPVSPLREVDAESIKTTRSIMSKLRPSFSTRKSSSSSSSNHHSTSIFGASRRPNTAPSSGSSDTGLADNTFVAGGGAAAAGATPDLVSLVCVSLIQTTFSSNDNINDGPEHRRKLLSVADLEEVDVHALLLNSESGSQAGSRPGSSRSVEEMAQISAAAQAVRAAGVRVLVGSMKISGTTPPSFRCHGIEVKYALKVDLLPANRYGSGEGIDRAMRTLGLGGGRARGFSEGMRTTASLHTQTQFTSLSAETGVSPPTTPPNVVSPVVFGSRSPGSRGASPLSACAGGGMAASVGVALSTNDESAVQADRAEAYPNAYPQHHQHQALQGRATPSVFGSSAASMRTGWASGQSISETSGIQSSIYMSEWGRDRKTVSKINKTIGEMWLDVRLVRGYNAY